MKSLLILFLFLLISISNVFSEDYIIPEKLGISYVGEEFYLTFHPTFRTNSDIPDLVKLYLSSQYDTKVVIKVVENDFLQTVTLQANKITTVSIPFDKVLLYVKPKVTIPDDEQLWTKRALVITADDPVMCYAMLEGLEKTEGFLALPKQSLGRSYIVASTRNVKPEDSTVVNTSYTSIVGAYDDTKITITLGGEISNRTPKGLTVNEQIKFTMNKGDVYLLPVVGNKSDVSGTKIYGTKPVSVISGCAWAHIPDANIKGNYTIEQELPVEAMGNNYSVFPYSYDQHPVVAKIFSTVDTKTDYYKNGELEGSMKKFGGAISDAYNTLKITEYGATYYTATNPVYITQYEITDGKTSPFQMALLSENQYNKSFRFITPTDYEKTYLSVIYKCPEGTYDPAGISLSQIIGETIVTKILSEYDQLEDLFIKSDDDKQDIRVHTVEIPSNTLFEINAEYPIAAYLYGYKSHRAFGYPVGTYLNPPKYESDSLAPVYSAGNLSGNKINGTVRDNDEMEPAFISGLGEPFLMNCYSANVKFTNDEFSPGTSNQVKWTIEILDLKKSAKAVIVFNDKAGNQVVYEYEYIPNDTEAPALTHKINRFGKITATATDEPKTDNLIRVGLKSIELGEESSNYILDAGTLTAGMNECAFTAMPIDPKNYGKAVIIVKDKNDNEAKFTEEYNPDNQAPICNWSKPDQFTVEGRITDMPSDDSVRINLDTLIVTETDNVETIIDAYTPNPREIKFTLKQTEHSLAGSVTLYTKDKYDNDTTLVFTFEASGGVDSDDMSNFVISPNPAGNYLSISTNGELIDKIEIFNNIGSLIAEYDYSDRIDISSLPTGIYYSILHIGSDRINRQFVILR